jgi:hypothetical protein
MLVCELKMRLSPVWITSILIAFLCPGAPGQNAAAKANAERGMPPRATPGDYQAQARAGNVTIAAEFTGHSVPKPEGPLSTEDYVVVETGFYGAPGTRLTLSVDDFSLRINGKKKPFPSQPFGLVASSLKDPQWIPPDQGESKSKSKGGLSTGGQGDSGTPPPVHVPIELQRAMAQYIDKASLPEGDRALPQAGLLFFEYRGKRQGIHSLELLYSGPAGKATLELQP